jgi:membrane protein DedA with SNARE-associated domain
MSPDALTELLLQYRYWILIPLSLIEGPVIALIAGTLAAVGYFNIYFLAALFFVRDVGLDLVYYAIGHFGGRTRFAGKMLKKLGITPDHLTQVHDLWNRRPGMTMLIGKLSYGIASAFIVVAGMVKMSLRSFIFYGSMVAILQFWGLLAVGYFFGVSFGGNIIKVVENIQYVLLFAAIVMAAYYITTWRARAKFLKADAEIQEGSPTNPT